VNDEFLTKIADRVIERIQPMIDAAVAARFAHQLLPSGRHPMQHKSCSVANFCERHAISEPTFYRRRLDMPRTIKIGGQLRIVDADEAAWIEAKRGAERQRGRDEG